MDKALKRKWIEALRSGKYKQGDWHLCQKTDDGPRYCCLGVLKHVVTGKNDYRNKYYYGPKRELCALWNGDPLANQLADKNDSGLSFKRIATWIEKNL